MQELEADLEADKNCCVQDFDTGSLLHVVAKFVPWPLLPE